MSGDILIKEDNYYSKITMDRRHIDKLPKHILCETIVGEDISGNYCFDCFLIYEKGKNYEF